MKGPKPITLIMYKVKYNRNEYRKEYLQSEEWKLLRSQILDSKCDCQCCKNAKATDVHHLIYRNIVDVKITDLLPVCRNCHKLIHQAINDGYITQNENDLITIKEKTLNICNDLNYKIYKKWLNDKHFLSESELISLEDMPAYVYKKISGLIKKNVWIDNIKSRTFTGRQIIKIRKIIQTAQYRKANKLETRSGMNKFKSKFTNPKYKGT